MELKEGTGAEADPVCCRVSAGAPGSVCTVESSRAHVARAPAASRASTGRNGGMGRLERRGGPASAPGSVRDGPCWQQPPSSEPGCELSRAQGVGAGRAPRSMAGAGLLLPGRTAWHQPRREKGRAVRSRGLAGLSLLLAGACCGALDRGPLGNGPVLPAALLTASPLRQLLSRESMRAPRPPAQPRGQRVGRRCRKDVDLVPGSKMGTATKLALHAE